MDDNRISRTKYGLFGGKLNYIAYENSYQFKNYVTLTGDSVSFSRIVPDVWNSRQQVEEKYSFRLERNHLGFTKIVLEKRPKNFYRFDGTSELMSMSINYQYKRL